MPDRPQYRLAHLAQKRLKCRITSKIRSQDNRVNKITHNFCEFTLSSTKCGRSYQDVLLTCIAVKQYQKSCQQRHVKGGFLSLRQPLEPLCQFLCQPEAMRSSLIGLHW